MKALIEHIREKSGASSSLDGTRLMEHVFGRGKDPQMPILKLNSMLDENDRSEQKGFLDLSRGAVIALRNPRAHRIFQDDPETALEFIAFGLSKI